MVEGSFFAAIATQLCLQGVVPGHAHNHGCQVHWHPMYMPGVGLEDFEECEQYFLLSNHIAPGICLSTPFHWHQAIEQHNTFHDKDKHASSGEYPLIAADGLDLTP